MTDIEGIDRGALIAALMEHQGEQSDERFCKRWLGVSASTWSRIKDGSYGAKNWDSILTKLAGALRMIEDTAASRKCSHAVRVLSLRHIKAVAAAVMEASHEQRDRLVVYLGASGSGKSKMAEWLAEYYHGQTVCIEATESSGDSYLSAVGGIGRAIGIKEEMLGARWSAEGAVLDFAAANPRIFVIDEAHHMGRPALNLCKAILNRGAPGTVVVFLAIPALWERMCKKAWAEAEQLRNRAKAVIRAPQALDPADLEAFLRDRFGPASWAALGENDEKAVEAVRQAVLRFGQWAAAERIAAAALNIAAEGPVTLADIDAAVAEQISLS